MKLATVVLVVTSRIDWGRELLATPERVLDKLALTVARLLAKVERVLAVLVLAVEKLLQNPMPLGSFTNIVELSEFTFECVEGRRQGDIKLVFVVVSASTRRVDQP
jgi:hypothetical protein